MFKKKLSAFVMVSAIATGSIFILSGCGTQPTVANDQATAPTKSNLITSTAQIKNLNIKTPGGRTEVNRQIDANLRNLNKSLNSLDRSMGKL